jgi:hypothetical protein
VSIPAELLTMTVRITGPTKSTFSARATRMLTGATRITVVAFGRKAHTGVTSATSRRRNRLPLPPSGGDRPAEVGVEPPPVPRGVLLREARDAFAHPTAEQPARLDRVLDLAGADGGEGDEREEKQSGRAHEPRQQEAEHALVAASSWAIAVRACHRASFRRKLTSLEPALTARWGRITMQPASLDPASGRQV